MTRAPLQSLDQALDLLLADVHSAVEQESVELNKALGRVLAADLHARLDVPPWDNSAMDGYAVRSTEAGQSLPVAQRIAAGERPEPLPGAAVARIFTGAPLPPGADAVVMQEDVQIDVEGRVILPAKIAPNDHVRHRGQDCRAGDHLLGAGRRLQPQDLGLIASQGISEVAVWRRLTVALLSTGSELREPGSGELDAAAIYNSNRPMLAALLEQLGCEVRDLGIVGDTPQATRKALQAGASADLVISSGGVSVGEADHVRDVVAELGEIDLWRIAIKPGKPFAKGRVGSTPFLGLPGNPSSAFVTFVLLARPFVHALQGRRDTGAVALPARADFAVPRPGSRREFLRVTTRVEGGELWATPYVNQSSGVLTSVSASDALAMVPEHRTLAHGDAIEILPLHRLMD